jgi:peptidyl-prolyl cis-trans isomerase SurA
MSGSTLLRRSLLPLLLLALALTPAPALHAKIVEQILIRVNSQIVTRADFEKRKATVVAGMQQNLKGDELAERMKTVDVDIMRHLTDEMLLIERAKQLYDLEKLIDFQQDSFMQNNGIKTKGDLEAKLKKEGLTMEQFRDEILHFGVPDFVRSREIRNRLVISNADIETYYNAHPDDFIGKNRRRVREIVLDPAKHPGAELDARRKELDKLLTDKSGEFNKIAGGYSDAANALDGGDMGFVKPKELRPEFDQAIFSLKEAVVSPPVQVGGKTFWFKVEAIEGEGRQPVEIVHDEIEKKMQEERYPEASLKFLVELWRNNYVVVAPEWKDAVTPPGVDSADRPAAPAAPPEKPKKKRGKRGADQPPPAG